MPKHMTVKKAFGKTGGMKYNSGGGPGSSSKKGGNKYGSVKGGGRNAMKHAMKRKGVNC